MSRSAYILRIAPNGLDLVPQSLEDNQITIGWSRALGLIDESLQWIPFRQIVADAYYSDETNYRKAGAGAGNLWRFLRDMKVGDYVVVPHWADFYVASIDGPPTHNPHLIEQDSAYRRNVKWLNNKSPIPRRLAKAALQSRMKIQGTSADATDLVGEIESALGLATSGGTSTFERDLQNSLALTAVNELRSGRLESYGFENLLRNVLIQLGAKEVKVIPRRLDKGADILATFLVAGAIQQVVAIQAKHWQPEPPVGRDVVQQLIAGIEAESANLGIVATSGTISEEAAEEARAFFDRSGIRIELMDGDQLARLMVENGILVR